MRSMTGYGRAQADGNHFRVVVEVRAVNSRHLDIGLKLPPGCWSLEPALRRLVQERCRRGRIEVLVRWESLAEVDEPLVQLHTGKAKAIKRALEALGEQLCLAGKVDLALMASFRDLWELREYSMEDEAEALSAALKGALEGLDSMRKAEGEALKEDLQARVAWMGRELREIQQQAPRAVETHVAKWKERVRLLAGEHPLDLGRMEQEAAIWVDRLDISEETVRLEIHLERFLGVLEEEPPVGKKLEFLVQEMHREVNTMGSKCMDPEISRRVVEMKAQLERMREQVQNIE